MFRRSSWMNGDEHVVDVDDDEDEDDSSTPFVIISSSDDDEEANGDLSLRIVEKSLSMRSRFAQSKGATISTGLPEVSGRDCSSDVIFNSNDFSSRIAADSMIKKMNGDLIHKICHPNGAVLESDTPHSLSEGLPSIVGDVELDITEQADGVDVSDNTVLRKLLRGPRYFDLQDGVWDLCTNCGERGHNPGECTSVRNRKKPCFICGSLEHIAKMCFEGKDCFICKSGGHRAKDCPEKRQRDSSTSNICLKCGNYGHDMFSCTMDYTFDDLKEIQCYICKDFGHLCCAKNPCDGPREVSCYRCGQLGHSGLACKGTVGLDAEVGGSSRGGGGPCFNCGEQGHFARECTLTPLKVVKKGIKSEPPHTRPKKRDYDERAITPRNKGGSTDSSKRVAWKKKQKRHVDTPPPTLRGVRSWSPDKSGGRYGRGGYPYGDWSGKWRRGGGSSARPEWVRRNRLVTRVGQTPVGAHSCYQQWWDPDGVVRRDFNYGW